MMLGDWLFTGTAMKLDPYLTAHTKINSKYIKGLNLEGKINSPRNKNKLFMILDLTKKHRHWKEKKIDKSDFLTIKTFCASKEAN